MHTYLLTIFPLLPPLPFKPNAEATKRRRNEVSKNPKDQKEIRREERRENEDFHFKGEVKGWNCEEQERKKKEEEDLGMRKEKTSGFDERKIRKEKEDTKAKERKALYIKMALEKYLEEVMKVEGVRNNRVVRDFLGL